MSKKKKNKVVAFTVATGEHIKYADKMIKSLRKFHSDKELPIKLISDKELKTINDPMFLYRATPFVGRELLQQGYDTVIKLDADQIITGDLSHTWEDEFDVGVVNNSNPRESKAYPVSVWNIAPLIYVNCGFVVMKSIPFVDHWWKLCASPHFDFYQMKEQDLLNIMVYYMPYNIKFFDKSDKWHGLISKGYWPNIELRETVEPIKDNLPIKTRGKINGIEIKQTGQPLLRENKLILPKNDEWPADEDKEIVCLHWAGGHAGKKMNYRLHFKKEVIKHLDKLVS